MDAVRKRICTTPSCFVEPCASQIITPTPHHPIQPATGQWGRLDEANGAGSLHGIKVGRETAEGLLEPIGTDERVALLNFHAVELVDGSADLELVGAGVAAEDEGVVVLDAAHGLFRVQGELDDAVGVVTGDHGSDGLAQVLGAAWQAQRLGQTEGARGADLACLGGVQGALDRGLARALSLLDCRCVYKAELVSATASATCNKNNNTQWMDAAGLEGRDLP